MEKSHYWCFKKSLPSNLIRCKYRISLIKMYTNSQKKLEYSAHK